MAQIGEGTPGMLCLDWVLIKYYDQLMNTQQAIHLYVHCPVYIWYFHKECVCVWNLNFEFPEI